MNAPTASPDDRLPHFVSTKPFDPGAFEPTLSADRSIYAASQWQLMWRKFNRHKLAVVSAYFLATLYVAILFCEFLAPYGADTRNIDHIYAPPQSIHLWHDGRFVGPYVYGQRYELDMNNLRRVYTPDTTTVQPIRFLCRGEPYRYFGLIDARLHLMCPAENGTLFILGTDRLGRDVLSRIIYGARISLTIGLLGVAFSIVLGLTMGGIAGYFGGVIDLVIQRIIEVLQSIPTLPLWLALAAILPVNWDPLLVYFAITLILGLIHWTGLARAVRSKLLALREEDYVLAAQTMGASSTRIIVRHLIPGFMSHLIATATLAVPGMILGETALSFLGLGLRPPITSWGVLLAEAQNINAVVLYPWLMLPAVPIILVVLAFNFLGDGLRDSADPYR